MSAASKTYRLLAPDGSMYESLVPGTLGGNSRLKIYGRLDCKSALRYVAGGTYQPHRVFFADEREAILAGYRPCGNCMRSEYAAWKKGSLIDTMN